MPRKSDSTHAKKRLGRGLSSLITNTSKPKAENADNPIPPAPETSLKTINQQQSVKINTIEANPYQPRSEFDNDKLKQLAESIRQQGILQPLLLTKNDTPNADKPYKLIAGERRLRAASLAGLKSVPVVIKSASKQQMLEWALIENIQREDLNPIERAKAYSEYLDRFDLTQTQASDKLGQPRATIANYLRILDLCDETQALLQQGLISFGHGKVLAGLAGQPDRQQVLAKQTVADNLSVRALEELITALHNMSTAPQKTAPAKLDKPAHLLDLEERFFHALGNKVLIKPSKKANRGKIIIEYYSLDDFDRITEKLGVDQEI